MAHGCSMAKIVSSPVAARARLTRGGQIRCQQEALSRFGFVFVFVLGLVSTTDSTSSGSKGEPKFDSSREARDDADEDRLPHHDRGESRGEEAVLSSNSPLSDSLPARSSRGVRGQRQIGSTVLSCPVAPQILRRFSLCAKRPQAESIMPLGEAHAGFILHQRTMIKTRRSQAERAVEQ